MRAVGGLIMKAVKISAAIFILLLFICPTIMAAPAGNPSDTKIPYGDGILKLKDTIGSVKVSLDVESIIDRELEGASDVTDAEMEGEWYLLRFGYPMFEDVFEPYVKFGLSHLETSWKENGIFIVIKGDNDLAWGLGARFLAYEIPRYNNLKFVVDWQYRSTDSDIDDVTVNDPSRTVSASEFKISEWQISGVVSMEFPLGKRKRYGKFDIYSIIPYVGIGYSDCKVEGKFTHSNTDYNIGDAESDDKVVLITGCDLLCQENLSLNAETRLIGETSVSGGATFKF